MHLIRRDGSAKRRIVLLAFSIASLAVVAGYSPGVGATKTQGKSVIYLGCDQANPFCASYNKTMESGLRKAGFSVKSLYNEFDPAQQAQQMAQATAQKPDALVVFVADSTAIVPSLARAHAANIPVIVVGTDIVSAGLKYVSLVNVEDSSALGHFAAVNLVEGMKKQGLTKGNVIAITGTSSQLDTQKRMAAFKAYLAKYPQFKLVAVADASWDPIKSATLAKSLYAKYSAKGGVQGVYGMADYMAIGTINAAKGAGLKVGLPDGIIFTGSNCSSSGVQAIRSGELYGDATQSPIVEAGAAVGYVVKSLNGQALPRKKILNHEARFTKANLAKYAKQCTY